MRNKLYRLTVAGVEQTLKMKFFIIFNIVMIIITLGITNFDTIKKISNKITGEGVDKDILEVMVLDETGRFIQTAKDLEVKNLDFVPYTEKGVEENKVLIEIKYNKENIINAKITSNEYIDDQYYTNIQNTVNKIRTDIFSKEYGVSLEQVEGLNKNVVIERVILKVNYTDYMKYEGVLVGIGFVMYVLFIFVASAISSTIGLEKISKTTEYMLTGISETIYLWYNVLQVNIIFIIQMVLTGLYYIVGNIINTMLSVNFLGASINNVQQAISLNIDPILLKIILLTFVQTILCVLILSIIQAIMTSKVNNMTDISNSSMLVITLVILVCFVSPYLIDVSGTVSLFVKIISCLPVFSIVMVPKLILLHQISDIGIIIAVIINVLTLILLSIFGARWFKKGLLDSGNSNKTDKRNKDEIYDLNRTRFKEVIFKVSISMLMYFVVSNLLGLVGMLINSSLDISKNMQSIVSILVWVLSIVPSYLYLKPSLMNSKIKEGKSKNKVNIKEAFNLILMGLFSITVVQYIMSLFVNENTSFDITELLNFDFSSPLGITLFILQLSILPAIFEELLFRKAILKMLSKYGNTVAIILSAICFGLIHQNFTQGIFAFLLGLILAFITIKTKSIIPAMIIHFLNNFTAVIATISEETGSNMLMNILIVLIFVISIVSGICLLYNILKNRKIFELEKTEIKINNVLSSVFSQFIVLITLFLYIIITVYVDMIIF